MLAFSHATFVAAGWGGTAAVLVGYALLTIRRGRRLSTVVPPDERRWS